MKWARRAFPWVIRGFDSADKTVLDRDLASPSESRMHDTWNDGETPFLVERERPSRVQSRAGVRYERPTITPEEP